MASATSQSWTMQRDVLEIGKVWNESIQLAFHVQSFEPRDDGQDRYSGLMLHNETRPDWSGMWIMNDGPPTGGRAFPDPLQTLNAVGYAGLGFIPAMRNTGLVDLAGPWSRFHLFHNVSGTRPLFAHRPQMRNGITLTGNSDHAYVGQWFDQGTDGSDPEVDDNSNLVFATSDDELTDGTAHHWDNMSFRFFSDLSGADGPASTPRQVAGLRRSASHLGCPAHALGFFQVRFSNRGSAPPPFQQVPCAPSFNTPPFITPHQNTRNRVYALSRGLSSLALVLTTAAAPLLTTWA
ncbi:MAG: hypothetical protein IPO17_07525 [Flavobacteriales bacterium]|nr:hypothetical protein [Flavobacteriales bacterium]